MLTAVAAATLALYVIATCVGEVIAALTGVAPTTSVVYCGTPLSVTGRSNVTVTVDNAAVASVTTIAVVVCGLVTPSGRRRTFFERLLRVVSMLNLLEKVLRHLF
jgi:hypothetical protein